MANSKALQRQEYIWNLLETHGYVSAKDLAERLKVSIWTVRRDLGRLEDRGVLKRYYGGADPVRSDDGTCQLFERESMRVAVGVNLDAKRRIGRVAARLLHSGERVALAGGSTTLEVAKALRQSHFKGEIITNALDIALELSGEPEIHTVCTGGDIVPRYRTMVGTVAEHMLKINYFDAAIVGVAGISVRHGITVNSQVDAAVLELMLEHACRTILVADSTKFGRVCFASFASAVPINTLVTDAPLPWEYSQYLQAQNVQVLVAGPESAS